VAVEWPGISEEEWGREGVQPFFDGSSLPKPDRGLGRGGGTILILSDLTSG